MNAPNGSHADTMVFEPVDPLSDPAVTAVSSYQEELAAIFGFSMPAPTPEDAATFRPPHGYFAVATDGADAVACGGLRRLDDATAEIKRMWVHPDRRGAGLARRLLTHLEEKAADLGYTTVRLDTNEHLPAAIALYNRTGYRRIPRYNDNPDATHFFGKALG